jgi:hypothetical protein
MRVDIYIGEELVDMFPDENVEINSSIADVQDITKNTTDYTKTFSVPSSSNNDKLFKHYYDANIDSGFDARIKVTGRIELDGMLFKKGKWRLSKVIVKKGQPSSYSITFWGNLLDVKDILGKDELSDLPLTAFDHDYTSANVKLGLESSLFSGDMIYNLFTKKQLYYTSDVTDTFISDTLVNIGWGNGSGSNGVLFNDLRPSLKIIKLIEAIESKYTVANGYANDIVFSREFFGRTEFSDLFMWLNPSKDTKLGGDIQQVDYDGGDSTYINHATNIGSYEVSNDSGSNNDYYWFLQLTITPASGFENIPYTVKSIVDGDVFVEKSFTGTQTHVTKLYRSDAPSDFYTFNVSWDVETSQSFQYTASNLQRWHRSGTVIGNFTTTATAETIDSVFTTSNNVPKLKTIDFIKGLAKMFKLVLIPQSDGAIYVNNLENYYAEGGVYDVTKYIDYEQYEVSRGDILNEINFLFQEPTTILNKQFEENTGIAYGDQETLLKDEENELLDGDTLEFTLPFEQIIYERLNDLNDNNETNIQYGAIINDELKAVNPKAHLFYNINEPISTKTIGFIDDSSTKIQLSGNINTPSHTIGLESSNFSTIFDSEFSTWNGQKISNTLYTNYHQSYINSIFNVKRRNFKYKAKLPLRIMLDLQLNDVLQIKDNYYRIDNYNSNLITGDVSLNLINSFDNTINGFSADAINFFVTSTAQQISTYVTNLGTFTSSKVDQGSGIDWITISNNTNNVFFDLLVNSTGSARDMFIDLTSNATSQTIRIYINQAE